MRELILLQLKDSKGVSFNVFKLIQEICFENDWMDIIFMVEIDPETKRFYLSENNSIPDNEI